MAQYLNFLAISFAKKNDITSIYKFDKELGSGGYGTVYLGINKLTGEKRAIKAIKKTSVDNQEAFRDEIKILMGMDHPNIIKLYEIFESEDYVYLVQEVCEGGELFYHITNTKHLTEDQVAQVMRQIFGAVQYCHANNVCHRDLKPENFLLKKINDISSIKLIDFGLAKQLAEGEKMKSPNGTPYYIAPEIITGDYDLKVDNWSLGVVMYVMLTGSPPFYGTNNKEILRSVLKGVYTFNLKPFKSCSDEVKD